MKQLLGNWDEETAEVLSIRCANVRNHLACDLSGGASAGLRFESQRTALFLQRSGSWRLPGQVRRRVPDYIFPKARLFKRAGSHRLLGLVPLLASGNRGDTSL